MLRRITVTVFVIVAVSGAETLHAGGWPWAYKDCPRPSYSPLHYWAPSVYRVSAFFTSTGEYTFAHGHGSPTHIVKFHCPAVDPANRYMDTGLPYDPNGPFAPLAPLPPADAPKMPPAP